jgi:hypothetical protein
MALIPLFHVVADHYTVEPGEEIIEGDWVKIDSTSGNIVKCDTAGEEPLGIAGDTKSTSTSGLASTNDAVGAQGATSAFVHRVSDMYDETKASGRITVYHGGGKFATNRYGTVATTPGVKLYVDGDGKTTTTSAGDAYVVGRLVTIPGAYDSGVPGLDTSNNSMSLGNFLVFKMKA